MAMHQLNAHLSEKDEEKTLSKSSTKSTDSSDHTGIAMPVPRMADKRPPLVPDNYRHVLFSNTSTGKWKDFMLQSSQTIGPSSIMHRNYVGFGQVELPPTTGKLLLTQQGYTDSRQGHPSLLPETPTPMSLQGMVYMPKVRQSPTGRASPAPRGPRSLLVLPKSRATMPKLNDFMFEEPELISDSAAELMDHLCNAFRALATPSMPMDNQANLKLALKWKHSVQ
ncbi:hypothetical protein BDP27DRAFT_1428888 [Rhodocollybia butyracea]|uniref:Uncharacterized protein n=1 Tax=Rhodocollybia butyracea TaxID=206335 RepID=A0A9P5PCT0_9AGAR|nr:hypothetical protein BDP27DRAFT_1428888 [Rhodocollybia butyracea]